jgi:malate dehydrogenase (oxaloacetate-decarboxylating)
MREKHTVRDWMLDLVIFVEPEQTVAEALVMMRRRYINSVIVQKSEHSPAYGIVTSRDISDKIVAENRNPKKLKIKEIMSSPVVTVPMTMSIKDCAALMKKMHIHHLPVENEEGLIVGMISAGDFLVIAEAMGSNFEERSLS